MSDEVKPRGKYQRAVLDLWCLLCNRAFKAKHNQAFYCTKRCKTRARTLRKAEYQKAYGESRRTYRSNWYYTKKYGMSLEEKQKLVDAQGGVCAICGTTKTTKRGWQVDHCHTTGNVRGVLCHHCNLGLGNFKDSEENLVKAIKYLERAKTLPDVRVGGVAPEARMGNQD